MQPEKQDTVDNKLHELKQLNEQLDRNAKLLIRRDLELTRANEKLRDLDRMKSEFVSLVTHQLRTPLSGIKWSLSLMIGGEFGLLNREQQVYLMKIYEANDRMIALINDLLQADRVESGTVKLQQVPTQLLNLLENVIVEMEQLAGHKNVRIDYEHPKELPLIPVDPENMRVILQNLIENAVKYTPPGGVVTISLREADGIEFSVTDTGIGIPKEQQKHVFRRFFRAPNAVLSETEGSGLGLYIVENIVRRHGGTIRFTSTENVGTTFIVTLPKEVPKTA